MVDPKKKIKFMSYNVWSREDVVVYKRMQAISGLVCQHSPDVIFFQEATPYIHRIFQSFSWWKTYYSSSELPFEQQHYCLMLSKLPTIEFRRPKGISGVCLEADMTPTSTKPIRIATTQLDFPSPTSPASIRCMERYRKAEHAVDELSHAGKRRVRRRHELGRQRRHAIPSPAGWVDAWTGLRGQAKQRWSHGSFCNVGTGGWTYDAVVNPMLKGSCKPERRRSDRFRCKLKDYALDSIEMVGAGVIPHCDDQGRALPVLPSHHFGLLLTISSKQGAQVLPVLPWHHSLLR